MQRVVALALLALALVAASVSATEAEAEAQGTVDIELSTDASAGVMVDSEAELTAGAPVIIPRAGEPARLITAATFSTRGGRALPIETSVLLLDGKPVVRLLRVEGELAGSNAELNVQLNGVPKALRRWLQRFMSGKFKRHRVSIITRTPGTGTATVPLQYSRYDYKGVLIRELSFPKLGTADGVLRMRWLYQSSKETKNVKQRMIAESSAARLRSEFFKLQLTDADGKADKQGVKMGKAVYAIEPFHITRTGGFGKQSATDVAVRFRAASDKSSALDAYQRWLTQPTVKGTEREQNPNPKERRGTLTLYYWSGASMERSAGADAHGQLKVLFTLQLNGLVIDKLESGDGRATLKADNIEIKNI